MKIVDANVLLHAVNEDSPQHGPALGWLDAALSGAETVGFAWVVLLAFLRLTTRAGLWRRPLTVDEACGVVEGWLTQPSAVVVHPTSRHLQVLHGLLITTGTASNLVTDAHMAALAVEHGAEVVSFDRDFGRFPGLRWHLPE
ncbi:MAG: type II toxin-antitoxin system VapC family toxin [Actinomycetota bacterium]|nr:type II toxin-antitoxin system VapC family toxin [Actinomycetota bacterium]MDQ6946658.1 type II toxin-antitoxin system VapC family toxin [Actinomycetota bacterium]